MVMVWATLVEIGIVEKKISANNWRDDWRDDCRDGVDTELTSCYAGDCALSVGLVKVLT